MGETQELCVPSQIFSHVSIWLALLICTLCNEAGKKYVFLNFSSYSSELLNLRGLLEPLKLQPVSEVQMGHPKHGWYLKLGQLCWGHTL